MLTRLVDLIDDDQIVGRDLSALQPVHGNARRHDEYIASPCVIRSFVLTGHNINLLRVFENRSTNVADRNRFTGSGSRNNAESTFFKMNHSVRQLLTLFLDEQSRRDFVVRENDGDVDTRAPRRSDDYNSAKLLQ